MMENVSEQWNEIERRVPADGDSDSEQLQDIVQQVGGVRDLLKKMCRASVTRTTLKAAVREALVPVIREHRDELFPELVELRRRLEAADEDPSALAVYEGGGGAAASPDELADLRRANEEQAREATDAAATFRRRLEGFETRISQLGDQFRTNLDGLRSDFDGLTEADSRHEEALAGLADADVKQAEAIAEQGQALGGIDGRIDEVRESLGELEATIPETAQKAANEVEMRLRKEIADMVEQLTERLAELKQTLGRLESTVPSRDMLVGLDQRLDRLEASFEKIAGVVESSAPEVRALATRFEELRREIGEVSADLSRTGDGVGEVRQLFAAKLDELQGELKGGIDRWESDQSAMHERLSNLRDTLRDQLGTFNEQVQAAEGSLWGKITGKKEAGLKLNAEEFDHLSGKLEGIITGLEKVIARRAGN